MVSVLHHAQWENLPASPLIPLALFSQRGYKRIMLWQVWNQVAGFVRPEEGVSVGTLASQDIVPANLLPALLMRPKGGLQMRRRSVIHPTVSSVRALQDDSAPAVQTGKHP